ncbi:MAG: NAD(P)/FAD-dependent oxidoreductase [Armatimonadetes bacterium]|nr:NAD(P)/FAD-dependent oxidoreductase [Armatimonadota bacterium]
MADPKSYDMVVIGGGAAGICAGAAAAGLGARTLVVDKSGRLGGECSWSGCVPSKALLHLASVVHLLRRHGANPQADELVARALGETRRITVRIAEESASQAFLEHLGAEVRYGVPRLTGPQRLEVDGEAVRARRVVLATGSSPRLPDLPGLDEAGYLTNQNLFDLDSPPASLVVLGAGPVGIEMAQAFARLGTRVTILTRGQRILSHDDGELALQLTECLVAEGLRFVFGVRLERVEVVDGLRRVHFRRGEESGWADGEAILVAVGRRSNVEDLGLDTVGVAVLPAGLQVDRGLRTSQRWLLGAGDVVGRYQFSHVAEDEARVAVRNAFFPVPGRINYRWAPWATFTDPELAHLGRTEEELQREGAAYRVYRCAFANDDRARTDDAAKGQVKLLATPLGKLLGAHVLGPRAGEVVNEIILGVKKGANVRDLAMAVHIYPTLGMATQRAADQWFEEAAAKPWVQRGLRLFTRRGA